MNYSKLKICLIMLSTIGALALFQNCGKQVAFTDSDSSLSLKGDDLIVVDDFDIQNEIVAIDDQGENPNDNNEEDKDEPKENPSEEKNDEDKIVDNDGDKSGEKNPATKENHKQCKERETTLAYRCIVEGNGNSKHIGYIDGKASVDQNTPGTLCMSESACLETMSEVFDVKAVRATGYCKNGSAHTISISDEKAKELVDALKE